MKFDDFEVGKEYRRPAGSVVRVVDKADGEFVVRHTDERPRMPFYTYPRGVDFSDWRPYTPPPPPPAPVVRYGYAYCSPNDSHVYGGFCDEEAAADNDKDRVGPVVKVELPVDPDMLARVKGGAS